MMIVVLLLLLLVFHGRKSNLSVIKDLGLLGVSANFIPKSLIKEHRATCK
jgi:hypothetical protein